MTRTVRAFVRPAFPWPRYCRVGLLALVVCGSACSSDLSPGQPLLATQVPIGGATARVVSFDAPPALPIWIVVSSRSVDVRAVLTSADAVADAPNRRMGMETILVEAPHAPTIELRIERNDHAGARGRADIVAEALPVVTEDDRRRLEAVRLEAAGCRAFSDVKLDKESAQAFDAAARLHRKIGDRRREGLARLHAAGAWYTHLSGWAEASKRAAAAARSLNTLEPERAAYAIRLEGAALDQRANAGNGGRWARARYLRRARAQLTEASRRFESLGNPYEAAYALNYRGVSYDVAGERKLARRDFQSALALFREAGDAPGAALSLQSLALQSHQDGRLRDALREFDQALAMIPRDEDPENYAHTLHNSAWPLRAVGRFDEAMARFLEAGEILGSRGDRDGEARALHGLGTTLTHAGEPQRAVALLQAAIRLRRETGARREQAISLLALGELERESGQIERAITHHEQALKLLAAPHDLAQARLVLARAYDAAGRAQQARRELHALTQLDLPPGHRYLGLALTELGALDARSGQDAASRDHFARAIEILGSHGADLEHARTLVRRAEARLGAGDATGALLDSKAAIAELDGIGLQSVQAESRAAFRASYRDAVEWQTAALLAKADQIRQRRDAGAEELVHAALIASDLGRGFLLAEAEPNDPGAASPEMLNHRRGLYESLAGKRQQRDRLLNGAAPDARELARLTREIEWLRVEASRAEREIASLSGPLHGRKSLVRNASVVDLIPEQAVVAEYFIGRSHAWLFVAQRGKVLVHFLGTGNEIEKVAHRLHMAWRQPARSQSGPHNSVDALSRRLFGRLKRPGPGESLYLVPDGPLHLVPMAVLAERYLMPADPGTVRIVRQLSVAMAPKAVTGDDKRRLLAVVADPIYSRDDVRLRGGATPVSARLDDAVLTRHARELAQLRRLPAAALEADAIARLAGGPEAALLLTGHDAALGRIAEAGLDQFRIVHFATHALADSRDPALATLALSRFDRNAKALDGDLRSFEIAQLRLNADLVVLSACDTALGREIAGEGPLGLAHAFLAGGADAVLATLWRVPDTSTARLMEEFYRQMLVKGRLPAAALELAQARIRGQPRWSDPYYWAGFQLVSNTDFGLGNNNVARRGE